MKRILSILALSAIISTSTSCTGLVVRAIIKSQGAVPNWVAMHENPKVGDYAIHRIQNGNLVRYEILSKQGDLFEMSQKFTEVGIMDKINGLQSFSFRIMVDKDGYVKGGFMDDYAGDSYPLRVVGPGEVGYFDNMQLLPNNEIIGTEAGSFECKTVRTYNYKLVTGMGQVTMRGVAFLNPKVKFQIIRMLATVDNDMPLVDLMNQASPQTGLLKFVMNRYSGSSSNKISAELIEMGPEKE